MSNSSEEFEKVDRSSRTPSDDSNTKDQWTRDNEQMPNEPDLLAMRMSQTTETAPKSRHEFYLASHAIFVDVERFRKQLRNNSKVLASTYQLTENEKAALAGYAKDYTTLAYAYLDNLTNMADDPEETAYVQDLARLLDLSERVCFSQNADNLVSDLRDWLNFNWPLDMSDACTTEAAERDSEDDELVFIEHSDANNKSDEHQEQTEERKRRHSMNWQLIQRLLLRGSTKQAICLLESQTAKCPSSLQGHLLRLASLLRSMPSLSINSEFRQETTWAQWANKREAEYDEFMRLETESDKEVSILYKIICGDKEAIARTGTLLESFVGILIYCGPFQDAGQLGDLVNLVNTHIDYDSVTAASFFMLVQNWDHALVSYDDYWFQTHLGHLLTTAGLLGDDDDTASPDADHEKCTGPVQAITNVFSQIIARDFDMWSEAIDYIESCTVNREYWADRILDNQTASSDVQGLKDMLQYSRNRNLTKSQKMLHSKLAKIYNADGDRSNAIIHYAYADDISALDKVADHMLKRYLKEGVLESLPQMSNSIESTAMQSKYYAFLVQYTRLKALLESQQYTDAACLAKQLLQTPGAPKGYEMRLLLDLLPVLEASNDVVIFDEKDTLDLIRLLQHIYTEDPSSSARLKRCLSMNLANALLGTS